MGVSGRLVAEVSPPAPQQSAGSQSGSLNRGPELLVQWLLEGKKPVIATDPKSVIAKDPVICFEKKSKPLCEL